eukprot:4100510-Pyramimonas_sp.AAC.1
MAAIILARGSLWPCSRGHGPVSPAWALTLGGWGCRPRPAPCAPRAALPTTGGLALVAFPLHHAGAMRRLHSDCAVLGPRRSVSPRGSPPPPLYSTDLRLSAAPPLLPSRRLLWRAFRRARSHAIGRAQH